MRLLLDTHIVIWFLFGDERMPLAVRRLVEDADEVRFSMASLWEAAIKRSLGRKRQDPILFGPAQIAAAAEVADLRLLEVELAHVVEVERLKRLHGDPFDRLLLVQAQVEGLQLLTADEQLHAYGAPVLAA